MAGLPLNINPEEPPHKLYEGIEYKDFWNGLQKKKQDELEHALVRDLLPPEGRRIIDVGCGYGRLFDCYTQRFKQVVMVDGSISLLRQAMERTAGKAIYIACDVSHLPFRAGSFDSVLLIRVFHHIENSQACLNELHRLLCRDGVFIFSYCNKRNAKRVLGWLLGKYSENPFSTDPAGIGSTFISHHPAAVERMMLDSGFSDLQNYGVGVFDKIAGKLGSTGRWIPSGKRFSKFLGKSNLAPWIICRSITKHNSKLVEPRGFDDLLQCPVCSGELRGAYQKYHCLECRRVYPVDNGIIDMRSL